MSTATVLVDDDGPIRLLTLNRPERRNAIDLVLRVELADATAAAMADDAVCAIVLTGAGGAFCAGGDISSMQRQTAAETRPRAVAAARVIRELWQGSKPVIAAVEGPAMGAGLALALACDRVVAGDTASFGAAFVRVGLSGDMGIFASLPARIGPHAAKQMLMFAHVLDAAEAHRRGLTDDTVPAGTALEAAIRDARVLAAGPPQALAAIKSTLGGWPRPPLSVLDAEIDLQTALFDTDDFVEAVTAFREGRTPTFRGSAP